MQRVSKGGSGFIWISVVDLKNVFRFSSFPDFLLNFICFELELEILIYFSFTLVQEVVLKQLIKY